MALTQLQKIQAFDINKTLQKGMSKLMQTTLCLPISASYVATTKVVNTLVGPVALMKAQIIAALDNNPVMDAMNDAGKLLDIINANIGLPTLQIDANTLDAMNIFKTICVDFDDILPNAMKKLIDKTADQINDGYDGLFDLPEEMKDIIGDVEGALKDNAMSEAFDDAIKSVLSPLVMYRAYIKSSGIVKLIKRLQKFEKCMSKKEGCNRPVKEMYFPGTNKYNSQYYMDLFAINLKGEVQLAKLSGKVRGIEGKTAKTLKKLDVFRQPIKR